MPWFEVALHDNVEAADEDEALSNAEAHFGICFDYNDTQAAITVRRIEDAEEIALLAQSV